MRLTLKYFLFPILVFSSLPLFAQKSKPVLEQLITISVTNEKASVVLTKIAAQAGCEFSYNPAMVDANLPVTLNMQGKSVREVLNRMWGGKVEYRTKGKYIILQRKKELNNAQSQSQPDKYVYYSGYVRNASGAPLPWTSIYDKISLEATVTNAYGFYRIRFERSQLPVQLYFSKQGYADTTVTLQSENAELVNILMEEKKPESVAVVSNDSIKGSSESNTPSFFEALENNTSAKNISDTLYRKWQVSFLPFAGSNGLLSGNVINDYSFNILSGYSMGTAKAEFSGFLNLNRGDVKYAQLSGFANLNGGSVKGAQLSGFANLVRKDVSGFQASGFANVVFGKAKGVQLSGFLNYANDSVTGFQASGFANVNMVSMTGTQVSGFLNFVRGTVTGTQLGFVNLAQTVRGSQVGFFNLADSTNGIPVGFFSYVHKGYHKIEVSADEVFYTNVAFRTGVRAFHNIITSGYNPSGDSLQLWSLGYGVGTSIALSKKVALDFDVTASQLVKGNELDEVNLIGKGFIGTEIALAKKFSMVAGFTINARIYKTDYDNYPEFFYGYKPNIFYDHVWELDKTGLQMWFGVKIGLRVF